MPFGHFPTIRPNHPPRPVRWTRIVAKLLAFMAGCLISLIFILYDYSSSAPAVVGAWPAQTAPAISDPAAQSAVDGH